LESRPADDRPRLETLLTRRIAPWQSDLPPARSEMVRRWTLDELSAAWADSAVMADVDHGRRIFALARCIVCHRCGAPGGVSGPDLSSVARRFSPRDLLASIVEPSRAIDEKYLADTFELSDGRVLTGRVAPGDYREPDLIIVPNLLDPDQTVRFSKSAIVRRAASPVSPMPTGLLDTLTSKEIVDLIAFVLSAGSRSE
jgi:putative heme-binding domain-containing protein